MITHSDANQGDAGVAICSLTSCLCWYVAPVFSLTVHAGHEVPGSVWSDVQWRPWLSECGVRA
jgi:hypothetical protein